MVFAFLPVKTVDAKRRLSGLLSPQEREQLARVMFARTLDVLDAAHGIDHLIVSSMDPVVLQQAAARGASQTIEFVETNHSDSAESAADFCKEKGATTVLMAPIDVPLMTTTEVESLVMMSAVLTRPSLVIVPSTDGTGTNAMVRTPPDVVESRFGPGSFRTHVEQARWAKATVKVARPEGIMLDIDTPADLAAYLSRDPQGPVADYLRNIGVPARLNGIRSR